MSIAPINDQVNQLIRIDDVKLNYNELYQEIGRLCKFNFFINK